MDDLLKKTKPKTAESVFLFLFFSERENVEHSFFFQVRATQSALFLYQCHLVNQRLIFSRKNIVNGKTRILAIIASNNTRYGFRSLSKPYGIPALASPSGDKLHKIVIMNSSTIEQIIPQRNVHISHWFINKLIINQSFLTVSDKH